MDFSGYVCSRPLNATRPFNSLPVFKDPGFFLDYYMERVNVMELFSKFLFFTDVFMTVGRVSVERLKCLYQIIDQGLY